MTVKIGLIAGGFVLVAAAGAVAGTIKGKEAFQSAQYDVALKELTAGAREGDGEAFLLLGRMYGAGLGVKKDLNTAVKYYGRGAKANYPPAQKEFGTALALGDGVEQNVTEGLKWLLIAAQQGDLSADRFAKTLSSQFAPHVMLTARLKASRWLREHKKAEDKPARP